MKRININHVNQINIFINHKSDIKWFGGRKYKWWEKAMWLFMLRDEPPGYFTWSNSHFKDDESLLKARPNLFIKDKVVYEKPHLEIYLSNGKIITQYHETEEELFGFISEHEFDKKPWILIK